MGGLLRGQVEIVGVNVHLGTQVTLAKPQCPVQLARAASRAKTEVLLQGVVPWQIVGVTVRRDTRGTTVKQQFLAHLAKTDKFAKMGGQR